MFMSHAAERVSFKVNPSKTRSILKTNSGKLVMKVSYGKAENWERCVWRLVCCNCRIQRGLVLQYLLDVYG